MMTAFSGPVVSWGLLDYLQASLGGPVADLNLDAGPAVLYQGFGIPDLRVLFQKDQSSGHTGVVPMVLAQPRVQSANVIPAAFGTATVAALANVTSGTAMTLVSTNSIAVGVNIPIVPTAATQGAWQGNAVITAPLVLDFGFAFVTGTAASATWTVANSQQFPVNTPIVIAGAGAGGAPLLTWVTSQVSATSITTNDACVTSVTAVPVGVGNRWMPREGFPVLAPTAHVPFRAAGIGAFLDPQQALARNLSVTGGTSAAGNAAGITIKGWDVYWQPMTETIAAPAAGVTTFGKKAFKGVLSATPNFTEAHPYSVGTGDVFGFALRANFWEDTSVCWAAAAMTSSTGWTAPDGTNPATATTGDVRGTIQASAQGGGSGIGTTSSNGTVSSLSRSGNRLLLSQMAGFQGLTSGSPFQPQYLYGVAQF